MTKHLNGSLPLRINWGNLLFGFDQNGYYT